MGFIFSYEVVKREESGVIGVIFPFYRGKRKNKIIVTSRFIFHENESTKEQTRITNILV